MTFTRALMTLVTALVLALVPTPMASSVEEPAEPYLEATWPEVTAFHPERTDYVVEVRTAGYDRVLLRADGWPTEVAVTGGSFRLPDLPMGSYAIELVGCLSGTCTTVGTSPMLRVARALHLYYDDAFQTRYVQGGGTVELSGPLYPLTPSDGGEVSWELTTRHGEPGTWTGTTTYAVEETSSAFGARRWTALLELPAEVPDGDFSLQMVLRDDVDPFGPLEGRVQGTVQVDSVAPVIEEYTVRDVVYPARDGYLDASFVQVLASGADRVDLVVRSVEGQEVRRLRLNGGGHSGERFLGKWSGRDDDGRVVPEGIYSVEAVAIDRAGNVSIDSRSVRVEEEELQRRTTIIPLSPSRTVIDRNVGACSQLRSPSARGGRYSLGFYSRTRCQDPERSQVVAAFGAYLPTAFRADYKSVQLRMRAGGARGARGAYLIHLVEDPKGNLSDRTQMGPAMRDWKFDFELQDIHKPRADRPYVIWHLGLTEGSRYDVQAMELVVTYKVLD